jgi:hypothetical protein
MSQHNGAASAKTKTPLDAFRIVICSTVLINPATANISYVEIVDTVQLPAEAFGQNIGVQANIAVEGKGDYAIRLAWARGNETQPAGDVPNDVTVDNNTRINSAQLRTPKTPGAWSLVLEWRHANEAVWHRGSARAPIVFSVLGAPVTAVSAAPAVPS